MRKAIFITTTLFVALMFSCGSKKQNLGEYVYVDKNNILHCNKDCNIYEETPIGYYTLDEISKFAYDSVRNYKICDECVTKDSKYKIEKTIEEYVEKEREKENLKYEYKALRLIGMDLWGSFEEYYNFIKIDGNRELLNNEISRDGYYLGVKDLTEKSIWVEALNYNWEDVVLDESKLEGLYFKMRLADVKTGTFNDFIQSFNNIDDFVWYFKKCQEMGIVDSLNHFIQLIFEPNCEYCDELYEDY